ncbi:helix-turn-helix domain-containing protein [Micromonospora sp. WMMD1082]|uniref:winged helix-turn-helix transcriptional regulator n=1 Tax=Micromonospora sp. WMMD1082 TaxID=3016104 RepID=UPI0024160BAE|nr:helix-turn-helix domain-containing protein [Micromonospora sp. WMMD1082]MDG4798754.1 helix-turn-helix domain-containing protein [Micromonospora sp. WMMD1082]
MSPVLRLPVTPADHDACAATDILRRVGEKWSVLILAVLQDRPYGFNELDRAVQGLSRRILTRTLRLLEGDGLVSRRSTAERVEYALTDLGRSLLPLIIALGEWAVAHASDIEQARARSRAAPGPPPSPIRHDVPSGVVGVSGATP